MRAIATMLLVALAGQAAADTPLTDTKAFAYAHAMSFYGFDACGDGLGGRVYRRALAAKFAQCPFTDAARADLARHERLQERRSRAAMQHQIDADDGMPRQLPGMDRTCRAQRDSPEYRALSASLDSFAAGKAPPESVFPQPCDAPSFVP